MHFYWDSRNEIGRINEALICLYYQSMEHILIHLFMWSFSPNSLVKNVFASSFDKTFNSAANILCNPNTSSLSGKRISDLEVKITIWADRFSSLVLCSAHERS